MADVSITVRADGSGTVDDAIEQVAAEAAALAVVDLQAIWPVRTGRSRAGLRAEGSAVVGDAPYTDEVRQRGSSVPIVDSEAQALGERAAEAAATDADISDAMDGVITEILRKMER